MGTVRKCEQITLLYERANFEALSEKDREELEMHMNKCNKCNGYIEDSKTLDLWLREKFSQLDIIANFSEEEKQKLKESLNSAI
jgi:flavin-dependent dehydrogenase